MLLAPAPMRRPLILGRFRGAALGLLAVGLTACGTYIEPKPGVYAGLGVADDLTCEFGAPTSNLIRSWKCRRTEDMPAASETAKGMLESIPTVPPRGQ